MQKVTSSFLLNNSKFHMNFFLFQDIQTTNFHQKLGARHLDDKVQSSIYTLRKLIHRWESNCIMLVALIHFKVFESLIAHVLTGAVYSTFCKVNIICTFIYFRFLLILRLITYLKSKSLFIKDLPFSTCSKQL